MNPWIAIIMNLAGIIVAIGTASAPVIGAYITYQNWKAAKKHAQMATTVNNIAAVVGVPAIGDKHEPRPPV